MNSAFFAGENLFVLSPCARVGRKPTAYSYNLRHDEMPCACEAERPAGGPLFYTQVIFLNNNVGKKQKYRNFASIVLL